MNTRNRPPLPRTEALLATLRRRLGGQIWRHGAGTVLGALALGIALAFLADRTLQVPRPVRWVFLAGIVGTALWLARRELFGHLRRLPGASGMAALVERRHPELHEVLTSAVELRERDDVPPELLAKVCTEAERQTETVELDRIIDPSGPRRRVFFGLGAAASCTLLLWATADVAGIFLARLLGRDVAWPRRTSLAIEIPIGQPPARVGADEESIEVRVARGSDVPVIVRAEGEVPDAVTLRFEGGNALSLAPSGGNTFRTLLRSVQSDLVFHAVGGDDRDARPTVTLRVLRPPDIAGIAIELRPPAYSGLAPSVESDGDVEVLRGTELIVHVRPDPAGATGVARLFPEDREVPLTSSTWPLAALAGSGAEDSPPLEALAFELVPEETVRYRFELTDETGLSNPDPGLFPIRVVDDRAPEVELLAPGRAEIETVVGGALPLRVVAADDFGLAALSWTSTPPQGGDESTVRRDLAWVRLEKAAGTRDRGFRALASTLLDAADLTVQEGPAEGQQFVLQVEALDVREPEPLVGRSVPLRVRIVSADEFMRRLQDRLARARLDTGELVDLQREKLQRTRELISALESDGIDVAPDAGGASSALSGQRRVLGDSGALMRELAAIAESLVYSRIDERSRTLLDALDAGLAGHSDKSFHVETWRELVAIAGRDDAISASLAGRLVAALDLALAVSQDAAPRAATQLESARDAVDVEAAHDALIAAAASQTEALARLEELVERLAEWDNFQSVLALTRDILNRQKNLLERTRSFAKEQ
mgnify:CR=1 FL=1